MPFPSRAFRLPAGETILKYEINEILARVARQQKAGKLTRTARAFLSGLLEGIGEISVHRMHSTVAFIDRFEDETLDARLSDDPPPHVHLRLRGRCGSYTPSEYKRELVGLGSQHKLGRLLDIEAHYLTYSSSRSSFKGTVANLRCHPPLLPVSCQTCKHPQLRNTNHGCSLLT